MGIRILFVGFGKNLPKSESDEYIDSVDINFNQETGQYNFSKSIPTIYDYHIVFLNNPFHCFNFFGSPNSDHSLVSAFSKKLEEIKTLLERGHILVTTLKQEKNFLNQFLLYYNYYLLIM